MAADPPTAPQPAERDRLRGWGRIEQRLILPVATALFIASLLIMLAEGLSRFFLGNSYDWAEEAVRFLVIWAVLLTLAIAGRRGFHIRAEMLVEAMSPRPRRIANVIACLTGLGFAVILLWSGWTQVRHLWRVGMMTESTLDLPLWTIFLVLPLGALLLVVYYAEAIVAAAKGEDPFRPKQG